MKFFKKYLGNDFWETNDGRVFSAKLQCFIDKDDLPPTMKYERSMGLYEVYGGSDFTSMENGYRFVLIEFCEKLERHKKTVKIFFSRFQTIDMTWRKFDSIKDNKGWVHFEFGFIPGNAYLLYCEANEEFPDGIQILHSKKIEKNAS